MSKLARPDRIVVKVKRAVNATLPRKVVKLERAKKPRPRAQED